MGIETLQQQNPPVRNWRCRLTQIDLYSGRKTAVVVVVVVVVVVFFLLYFNFAFLTLIVFL